MTVGPASAFVPSGSPDTPVVLAEIRDGIAISTQGQDLSVCDREPIHTPGAIQPHGLLLIVEPPTLTVVAGAGTLEDAFGGPWLDQPLAALIGEDAVARLSRSEGARVTLGPVPVGGSIMDGTAQRSDEHWLVQLEPRAVTLTDAGEMLAWIDRAGSTLEKAADLRDLCDRAVLQFRELTGFDRVMIYRFLDDGAGMVIAEDREPGLHSFLNHHFPASDIPQQARALYIRNRVRLIADVDYRPEPIRPASAGLQGIDLSDVDLRSVAPVHIQYLRNMGVRASASVSIVKDGVLWGLAACHSVTPRQLSAGQRMACQVLAGGLARQVRAREEAEDYRDRLRLRSAEDAIAGRLAADPGADDALVEAGEAFRRALKADGFALLKGKALTRTGLCPETTDVREIAAWAGRTGGGQAVHTHALSERFPPAAHYADLASGLLAVPLPGDEPTLLLWFRAEQPQVVKWAGDPHKAVPANGEALTPRNSFEAWLEEVRGRAVPWSLVEVEVANRLLRRLHDARQAYRLKDLNRELTTTLEDKDALLAQKDYLLKEVNHRVQNSLQLVSAFLALQARAEGDETLSSHLGEAQRRLSAVALVHRRLYSDDNVELVDLSRYVEDLATDLRNSMGAEWAGFITTDLAPVLVPADAAVNLGLILTELVINAAKYAYGGSAGPLAVILEQHRNRLRLIVADQGAGKAGAKRVGFGSRMLAAMVERLSGAIEEADNAPGLRVIVTAPILPTA